MTNDLTPDTLRALPDEGRARAVVEHVRPEVDAGRFAVKRTLGDEVVVEADAFTDGHDALSCVLRFRHEDADAWNEAPMEPLGNERWRGSFRVTELGVHRYTVVAWVDRFRTWRADMKKRLDAGQDVSQELRIGAGLVDDAAGRAKGAERRSLRRWAGALRYLAEADADELPPPPATAPADDPPEGEVRGEGPASPEGRPPSHEGEPEAGTPAASGSADAPPATVAERGPAAPAVPPTEPALPDGAPSPVHRALSPELAELMARHPDRSRATRYARVLSVVVERERARFSAWYELFPRSAAPEPGRHGTFRDVEEMLPYVREMAFDVLYLPPIHPIGRTKRKGPNDAPTAEPGDPGSPWGIGAEEGGHKAVHPALGTLDDFRRLCVKAEEHGMEVALDVALQCSPDHPYVDEHPEWFRRRPDGTIQYAENPPKKYEDIYPFDFETDDWPALWRELASIFDFWIEQGVRIFRVDNPHTKPFAFWEWLIARVHARRPDVIFLSEAFTRPKVMYRLAKLGFTQSYTYFAWRNGKHELREYVEELTRPPVRDFFRPSFWPNTPDILTEYLQTGGRGAFMARLVLAATLSSSYGIYGPAFELQERRPREAGSEEYLHSEKYEIRRWELDREDGLRDFIARVNRIRRDNPALHRTDGVRFHETDNDELLAYSKATPDGSNVILVVVNLDPHHTRAGWVDLDLEAVGTSRDAEYSVHDLLGGEHYLWHGPRNYVELDPGVVPAHVFRVSRRVRTEEDFEYYM